MKLNQLLFPLAIMLCTLGLNLAFISSAEASIRMKVCIHGSCSNPCSECVYSTPGEGGGRLEKGGSECPPWLSEVDNRRWYNCTGKRPEGPGGLICINDYVNAHKPFNSINCKTKDGVAACCGHDYINRVGCKDKPAEECNCYNCAEPR